MVEPQNAGFAILFALAGCLFAIVLLLCVAAAHSQVVPRQMESARVATVVPWPVYAMLPAIVTAVVGIGIGLFVHCRRGYRIAFVLGVAAGLLLAMPVVVGLLHRDYIGKL